MKDNSNIDDIFRSGLEGKEIPPPEKSWDSLAADLDKKQALKKRNNRSGFFLWSFLLLLLGFVSYEFYPSNKDSVPANSNSNALNPRIDSKENLVSSPLASTSNVLIENKINKESIQSISAIAPAQSTINSRSISTTTTAGITESNPHVTEPPQSAVGNKAETEKQVTSPTEPKEELKSIENNSSSSPAKEIAASGVIVGLNNELSAPEENIPAQTNSSASSIVTSNEEEATNTSKSESTPSTQSTNGDFLTTPQTENSTSLLKKIGSHLSIEMYYSPDYVNNHLKVNDEYTGTASQDINDYKNQESAFSYSTGLNIFYDLGSKWSIGSGIAYSSFSQTAVYNTISVITDTVYQVQQGRKPPHGGGGGGGGGGRPGGNHGGGHGGNNPHRPPPGNGDNHFVVHTPCGAIDLYREPPHLNTGNHQNGDTLNLKTETSETIQFINVPLMVRYNFGKNKFKYFVSGGGSINFVKGNTVKVVIEDAYTETNEHDGLKSMNYSLTLGAGIQYNFYKKINVFLNPTFRYSITPVNQYNPMDAYPYYLGIGAGLSIHF